MDYIFCCVLLLQNIIHSLIIFIYFQIFVSNRCCFIFSFFGFSSFPCCWFTHKQTNKHRSLLLLLWLQMCGHLFLVFLLIIDWNESIFLSFFIFILVRFFFLFVFMVVTKIKNEKLYLSFFLSFVWFCFENIVTTGQKNFFFIFRFCLTIMFIIIIIIIIDSKINIRVWVLFVFG